MKLAIIGSRQINLKDIGKFLSSKAFGGSPLPKIFAVLFQKNLNLLLTFRVKYDIILKIKR